MADRLIYLDANATCPPHKIAMEAFRQNWHLPLNSSSVHQTGRFARKLLEEARSKVAKAINADSSYQVVFTATGTEANNLAIQGLQDYIAICSNIEHKSVLQVIGKGLIPVDSNGRVNLQALETLLMGSSKPMLVSVIYANNEVGIIQDIKSIAQLVHKYNGLLHTDASQAFGKIPLDIQQLEVDLITITAHKVGSMHGAAALAFRKNLPLNPIILGGGQEARFRSGTQDINAIHAFGVVAERIDEIIQSFQQLAKLRDQLEMGINEIANTVLCSNVERLPNTSSIYMPNVASETQVIYFDLQNIMISAGSACSSGTISLPYVHLAMGIDSRVAANTIRVSLHPGNSEEDIVCFLKVWQELYDINQIKELKTA